MRPTCGGRQGLAWRSRYAPRCRHGLPKQLQLADQFVEHADKTRPARLIRGLHRRGFAVGAEDQIDRAMLPMPAGRVEMGAGCVRRVRRVRRVGHVIAVSRASAAWRAATGCRDDAPGFCARAAPLPYVPARSPVRFPANAPRRDGRRDRDTRHSVMVNSIGATIAGVGTVPNDRSGMRVTSTITVMPPPGHT